ncbi:MAG TPA: OsmC family protein [Allosphingosinicella sp.]|jgi:uncharacterized OsmC-like protein
MLDTTSAETLNGIDMAALAGVRAGVEADPASGRIGFKVATDWGGATRSESRILDCSYSGETIDRGFSIAADEPGRFFGSDSAPNPQELLISAVNACMVVGYVAQATLRGVRLNTCRIETEAELDMRGFLGLDEAVPSGCRRISYSVTLDGDGTRDQYEEIHQAVMSTSPNYFNMCQPVQMIGRLA